MYPRYFPFNRNYQMANGINDYGLNNNYNLNQNYSNEYQNNSNYQNPYNYNYNSNSYMNNQNNFSNRGENGLENGIPNYQRQNYQQSNNNNLNNNYYNFNNLNSNANTKNNYLNRNNNLNNNNFNYNNNLNNRNILNNNPNYNNSLNNNLNNYNYNNNLNNYNYNNKLGNNNYNKNLCNNNYNNILGNNINYNANQIQAQNQNIYQNQMNYSNISNQNQNIQNGKEQNDGNNNVENGQSENKKENKKSRAELILDYENNLRKEIEKSTPLISQDYNITVLIDEYKSNEEYLNSIRNISKKYKYIRKVIRDGNCFYRSFIFRLFEHICIKNDKILFEKVKQKIIDAKELTEKNGYEWAVVEDFYNLFLKEFSNCFNSLSYEHTVRDYLDTLFCERQKGNYLIYFIRFCIAAYLREQKETYQMYIEGDFDEWVRNEVEAIDHEADQIQIMACVNYFDIGVKIEYLNKNQSEIVKLPHEKPDNEFFIFLLFTPGHYDILYP